MCIRIRFGVVASGGDADQKQFVYVFEYVLSVCVSHTFDQISLTYRYLLYSVASCCFGWLGSCVGDCVSLEVQQCGMVEQKGKYKPNILLWRANGRYIEQIEDSSSICQGMTIDSNHNIMPFCTCKFICLPRGQPVLLNEE